MALRKDPKQLLKFMAYMLGRRPDEFGLVPDDDGFVKIKELLQVTTEEDGWRYVRRLHIDEILLTVPDPEIEIKADAIRSRNRDRLSLPAPPQNLPTLLYTCVRRKAHPVVLEKGVFPMGRPWVVLSSSRDMAERMGRRKDPLPVLLTVNPRKMSDRGMVLKQLGQFLYLAESVPIDCFSGPPPARQRLKPQKELPAADPYPRKSAGTFRLELPEPQPAGSHLRGKYGKKEIAWKKDRRLRKKRKDNLWPDQ